MELRMKSNFHKYIIFSSPIRGSRMGDCEAYPKRSGAVGRVGVAGWTNLHHTTIKNLAESKAGF